MKPFPRRQPHTNKEFRVCLALFWPTSLQVNLSFAISWAVSEMQISVDHLYSAPHSKTSEQEEVWMALPQDFFLVGTLTVKCPPLLYSKVDFAYLISYEKLRHRV